MADSIEAHMMKMKLEDMKNEVQLYQRTVIMHLRDVIVMLEGDEVDEAITTIKRLIGDEV